MTDLRQDLLDILQHSRGLNEYGQGTRYRNHYVAGDREAERCRELVAMGYMEERPASAITGGDPWFLVTSAGDAAIDQFSPAPPVIPASKSRYRDFLDADGCTGDTFAEHLNIVMPLLETQHPCERWPRDNNAKTLYRYKRIRYDRLGFVEQQVTGDWQPTRKAAKASYKAALNKAQHDHRFQQQQLSA